MSTYPTRKALQAAFEAKKNSIQSLKEARWNREEIEKNKQMLAPNSVGVAAIKVIYDAFSEAEAWAELEEEYFPSPKIEVEPPSDLFPDLIPEFPAELKKLNRWIVRTADKLPFSAWEEDENLGPIDPHEERYQSDFNNVMGALDQNTKFSGAGFVFNYKDGYTGVDFDDCVNVETREIRADVREIIFKLDTYCEFSPSGTGIHAIVKGWQFPIGGEGQQGAKVGKAEIYSGKRYFTVTGNHVPGTRSTVNERDLQWLYERIVAKREFVPIKSTNPKTVAADVGEGTPIVYAPGTTWKTDKYSIFLHGVVNRHQGFHISNGVGSVSYPSQSEADLGFATVLALIHDGDTDKMDADFRKSALYRDKWEREGYRDRTFRMALEMAAKIKDKEPQIKFEQTAPASPTISAPVVDAAKKPEIPAFDDTVITGIFRKIVDFVTAGTTIPRQFPFLAAKVYVGARMAGGMSFEGVQDDPTIYGAPIGESGTSKGLSWERTIFQTLLPTALLERPVKVIYSFDSGAGLRDAFFDPPKEQAVIGYIDEVRSLGHKAGEKKNPEIVDTIIELANSHRISRSKAKRSKKDKVMSHEGAYLSLYMAGQDGGAFMSSFPGRTQMGLWDRFYPEFSELIEPGDLPDLDPSTALTLVAQLNELPFTGRMTMGEGLNDQLKKFWSEQEKDVRVKVRFKSHLMLDMYFSAWSQGRMVATMEDLNVAIRIFQRQVAIRLVHFSEEVPDRVGHYIGLLKKITEGMRKRLNAGASLDSVAMSLRDFQTDTNAFRENELTTFNTAWRNFQDVHLAPYEFTAKNGHRYTKFLPMPYEHEMWAATPEEKAAAEAAATVSAGEVGVAG